jgi:hypothetical protein
MKAGDLKFLLAFWFVVTGGVSALTLIFASIGAITSRQWDPNLGGYLLVGIAITTASVVISFLVQLIWMSAPAVAIRRWRNRVRLRQRRRTFGALSDQTLWNDLSADEWMSLYIGLRRKLMWRAIRRLTVLPLTALAVAVRGIDNLPDWLIPFIVLTRVPFAVVSIVGDSIKDMTGEPIAVTGTVSGRQDVSPEDKEADLTATLIEVNQAGLTLRHPVEYRLTESGPQQTGIPLAKTFRATRRIRQLSSDGDEAVLIIAPGSRIAFSRLSPSTRAILGPRWAARAEQAAHPVPTVSDEVST